jgi:hypothetical protein
MVLYSIENIIDFVKESSAEDKITADLDLSNDIGLSGDDFHEFIDRFALKFNVDMSAYLWYFHTNEEGISIGGASLILQIKG